MASLRALLNARLLKEQAGVARLHPAAGVASLHPVEHEESTSSPGSSAWGRGLVHREGTRAVEGSSRPSPAPVSGRGVTFGAEPRAPPPSGRSNKSPLVDAATAPAKAEAPAPARFESLAMHRNCCESEGSHRVCLCMICHVVSFLTKADLLKRWTERTPCGEKMAVLPCVHLQEMPRTSQARLIDYNRRKCRCPKKRADPVHLFRGVSARRERTRANEGCRSSRASL